MPGDERKERDKEAKDKPKDDGKGPWKTGISHIEPNKVVVRGYRIEELMGNRSFGHVVYLLLKGDIPNEAHGRMMDAILTACVDHGVNPPTSVAARTVASAGVPLPTAVAAGLLAVGDSHGGAIEDCMHMLYDTVAYMWDANIDNAKAAKDVVERYKAEKSIVPGLGHRVHTDDPRTKRLFAMADELGIAGDHVAMLKAIKAALKESSGKDLPINVDGAIAAVAADMGFDEGLGKGLFLIGRSAGLVAHVHEEMSNFKPMRKIFTTDVQYDGPAEKSLK
jgi:citrate synthase